MHRSIVSSLAAALMSAGLATACPGHAFAAGTTRVVAAPGDPGPIDSTFYNTQIFYPILNNAGQVAFGAGLTDSEGEYVSGGFMIDSGSGRLLRNSATAARRQTAMG